MTCGLSKVFILILKGWLGLKSLPKGTMIGQVML